MIQKDYTNNKKRWLEYWNKENHDRPIMSIMAPSQTARYNEIVKPSNMKDCWFDMDYVIKINRMYLNNTFLGGEAFPTIFPNLGPDILGAICGCDIEFGENTSWAVHNCEDWSEYPKIKFDPENKWWKKIKEMTEMLVSDSNGDYLVGVTDLHTGTDGLVSLRGPENLCMDIFDNPEHINSRIKEVNAIHFKVLNEINNIIGKKQEGSTNWMGIWHPEKNWYVTSSDFSCLISKANFEEHVIPGLEEELDKLPASIYHLDGPGALHHLDRLLELEKLNGIQWVQGAGAPPAQEWIQVYKKIQKAGKCIQAHCEPEDIEPLCKELEPEGVHLICYAKTEQEAKDLIALAEKTCKMKK